MKLLHNATLRKKLLYLVIASGAIAMLIVVMSYLGMNTMHDSVGTIYRDRVVPLAHLKKVSDYYAVNIVDATHKVRNSELTFKEGLDNIAQARLGISKGWQAYTSTFLITEEKPLVEKATKEFTVADATVEHIIDVMQRNDSSALVALIQSELYKSIDPVTGTIASLVLIGMCVLYFIAGRKYLNRVFYKEIIEVNRDKLTIIDKYLTSSATISFPLREISSIGFVGQYNYTRHPLESNTMDITGFGVVV